MARRILLTGANGYIAAHILSQLLEQGHSVRAVVRSQGKADQVREDHASAGGTLDFALVPDITSPGAFDKAVQSDPPFDAVIHTASPLQFANVKSTLNDMLIPAKRGTEEILRSIQAFGPSVRRVVFTSSFAAIVDYEVGNIGKVFSEEDWSPLTWDGAANSDNVGMAYLASKKYAEIAGWEFMAAETPNFDFVSLNPPLVYGPFAHSVRSIKDINQSNLEFYNNFLAASSPNEPFPQSALSRHCYIDVRDLATAHLLALTTPTASNKRFLIGKSDGQAQAIADILHARFPTELAERTPRGEPGRDGIREGRYGIDTRLAGRVLGMRYRTLEETVVEGVRALLEIEARGGEGMGA